MILAYGERMNNGISYEDLVYNPHADRVVRSTGDNHIYWVDPDELNVTTSVASSPLGSWDTRKLAVDPTRGWSYQNTRRFDDQLYLHVPQHDGSLVRLRLGSGHIGLPLAPHDRWMLAVDPGSGVLHMSVGTQMRQVEPIDDTDPGDPSSWAVRDITGAPSLIDYGFVAPGVAVGSLATPIDGSRFAVITIEGTTATVTPIHGIDGPAGTGTFEASYVAETADGHAWLVAGDTAQHVRIDGTTATLIDDPVTLLHPVYSSRSLAADPDTGSLWVADGYLNQVLVNEYRDGLHVGSLVRDQLGAPAVTALTIDGRGGAVVLANDHVFRVGRGTPATPPETAQPPIVIDNGHVDVTPSLLPDGSATLVLHHDGTLDDWWQASDVVFHVRSVPERTYDTTGTIYEDWLGAGEVTYVGPSNFDGLPWLGWSSTYMGRYVESGYPQVRLVEVDGPGDFLMGSLPNPQLASRDLDLVYVPPEHTHQIWMFAEPGVYRLHIAIHAVLNDGTEVEDVDVLTFVIGNDIDPTTVTPGAAAGEPESASQTIVATLDELAGALVISVDPDDRTVELAAPQLAGDGASWATSGELRPVAVTDTRSGAPGWTASGQVSDFAAAGGPSFAGSLLGWEPVVLDQPAGGGVEAGPPVAPGWPDGDGLATARTLASAGVGQGFGTAQLGAALELRLPTQTTPGTYEAVLTFTVM
ncbi:choice-of-anchor M domain-containing protein [Nitriliruptor alkaliphilus]|uniref:choice-of-anchor M domain-containing protein n=1 Tax=Nitriliruptor alkaliphilus TaxID=427918 RepID=UPI000696F333|nr:choice-of-anchor M domain-containing protein [Nitriliruptor alkaliphilus]